MKQKLVNIINRKSVRLAIGIVLVFLCIKIFFPKTLFEASYCTVLLDKEGNVLSARIAKDAQWRFPERDSVPEKYKKCLLYFEDEYFYYHPGINIGSIGRAIQQNISKKRVFSGGSTITMQLARISGNHAKRGFLIKCWEAIQAIGIEIAYPKEKILNLYVSHAPFGSNVVGLDAASWRYFGLAPEKLSWAESATLAVLPNAPSLIYPGKNQDKLRLKRNRLLLKMLNKQVFDSTTYLLAISEPLPQGSFPIPKFAPHLLDRAVQEGMDEAITKTTLDANLQKNVMDICRIHHQTLKGNHIYNIAALVINVETGNALAYVGNTPFDYSKKHGAEVDIIKAQRSTGSILKPFLYAACIEEGTTLPDMLVPDVPSYFEGYSPKNYAETFDGAVPAHKSLARSLNIPSVLMLKKQGIPKFLNTLNKVGLNSIKESADHYGLSLILGGAESNLWELCGAYASMTRTLNHYTLYNGKYNASDLHPLNYLYAWNAPTPLLKENSSLPFSAASIWFTYDALLKVNRPEEEASWDLFSSSQKIAWKTGTSFGMRDAWAIGSTPKYLVGVWVGNADGEGRPGLTGTAVAAPVMFHIFNALPKQYEWFNKPFDEMTQVPICHESGHRNSPLCEHIDTCWIPKTALRSQACPYHKLIHLDQQSIYRVNESCEEPEKMKHVPWFILPPSMAYYYQQKHADYKPLPPYRADCEGFEKRAMEIVYPLANSKLFIPRDFDQKPTQIIFEAVHQHPKTQVFWHIDGQYIGATTHIHQQALQPKVGKHTLVLVDQQGEEVSVKFEVVEKN